jgi:hypothetical protein
MNIEEKLAFVRKALELGAEIEAKFFWAENEEEAKKIGSELEYLIKAPFELDENEGTKWNIAKNRSDKLKTVVFFNN